MYLSFYYGWTNGYTDGGAGSGVYLYNLPSGYTLNTSLVAVQTPAITTTSDYSKGTIIGTGDIAYWGTDDAVTVSVFAINSTQIALHIRATQTTLNWNHWHASDGFQYSDTNLFVTFQCSFPIL